MRSLTALYCFTFLVVVCSLATTRSASAATSVPLNTGYNHHFFEPYPAVPPTSTTQDNYWIAIASYPPISPNVSPAWVLNITPSPWLSPFPATRWVGPRKTVHSPSGTSHFNPAYTLFQKCFCLLPNFKNPELSFRVRADDTIQAWVNTQLNVVLAPSPANFGGSAFPSIPSNPEWFRAGRNCLYILLEDTGGHMGFDLTGTVQADGLATLPGFGPDPTSEFDCPCTRSGAEPIGKTDSVEADRLERAEESDAEVVRQLLEFAEDRRLNRAASPFAHR